MPTELRVLADQRDRDGSLDRRDRRQETIVVIVFQSVFEDATHLLAIRHAPATLLLVHSRLDTPHNHVRRPQTTDLLDGMPLRSLADRQHGDDRAHAQDRTEHGQETAQLVQQEVANAELKCRPPHDCGQLRPAPDGRSSAAGTTPSAGESEAGADSLDSDLDWRLSAIAEGFRTT